MNIILKMEEMLKSWFPNVKLQDQLAATQTEEAVPTKKPKVKKKTKKTKQPQSCCVRVGRGPLPRTYGDDVEKEGRKYLLLFNHRSGIGNAGLKAIFTEVLQQSQVH